ncbi:18955_t:CDS:10 [Dentiscutata erythropus]|uniref:18955_t:CDS:1 n=1 Tax=Dentiscutata erythropus TaxID=1348616 RepID=A0A9N9GL61_9GLOM|nr:18955_t:CDS:10 [Dentiscutata erythropus]
MISAFFIYNQKGEVLISRLYRQDLKRSVADIFRIQVISNTDIRSPIVTLGSTSFFHVRHENLFIVAVTKCNANAALVFEFCYRLVNIGKAYFGKLDEEAVKNNFVLNLSVLDFGYPQNSETDTLKLYITTEGVKSERALKEDSSKITIQATGATSWRRPDIKYRKNEAFIDVIESINLLMSAKGTTLRADVSGQIMMRAYLSGTPECKFGLNDKLLLEKDTSHKGMARKSTAVEIDDCQFHQCVKLGKFDSDRTISFVPPDGEFELMRYRTTENVILPFRVHPVVNEIGKSRVEYRVTVKANFQPKLYANNVLIKIPTPLNTANINVRVSSGKAKYVPDENAINWPIGFLGFTIIRDNILSINAVVLFTVLYNDRIPRFQGQYEVMLSGDAELSAMTVKKAWSRPPISMDFQVLMFTSSGLLVRFLKVLEKSNYTSIKWVRYMTKAGGYQIRGGKTGYYPPHNRFYEGGRSNTGYNSNNQQYTTGENFLTSNFNTISRIPQAPYQSSPAYSSSQSSYPSSHANLPHSSGYDKRDHSNKKFLPPGHASYKPLDSYLEDKEMLPTAGYSAVAPATTGPQPPKNYDTQKLTEFEDEPKQEAKHGGLMKYFCCGSRASCGKTCAIICCIILLIIIGIIAAVLLFGRVPSVDFLGVVNSPTGAQPYVMKASGFDFNFGLRIQVNNPNVIGATFSMIKAVAYYPGHQNAIGGGNLTNVNIPSKSNTTINFPFTINYDASIDPGFSILLDIATKCGLTGGNKTQLEIDYTLTLSFNVLFIPLSPSFQKTAKMDCPIQNGQIPNIPGFNISQIATDFSNKTSNAKRFMLFSLL